MAGNAADIVYATIHIYSGLLRIAHDTLRKCVLDTSKMRHILFTRNLCRRDLSMMKSAHKVRLEHCRGSRFLNSSCISACMVLSSHWCPDILTLYIFSRQYGMYHGISKKRALAGRSDHKHLGWHFWSCDCGRAVMLFLIDAANRKTR